VSASNFTMADFQVQRAYLKQPAIFQNSKKSLAALGKKRSGAKAAEAAKGAAAEVVTKSRDVKLARYVRNVGLGFKTPASAVTGGYIDKKCPFTGNVSAVYLHRCCFLFHPISPPLPGVHPWPHLAWRRCVQQDAALCDSSP
jgi:hypothetical protein